MPALTAAADLKMSADFSLPLRLMDFSFQSRTLLSDGINHKIPHFKSMISWRTTAHFISYQEIEQISHISRIKWHFRKFIWTKNEVSSVHTPISLKVVSVMTIFKITEWCIHKEIHICMHMPVSTPSSHKGIYKHRYTHPHRHPAAGVSQELQLATLSRTINL